MLVTEMIKKHKAVENEWLSQGRSSQNGAGIRLRYAADFYDHRQTQKRGLLHWSSVVPEKRRRT